MSVLIKGMEMPTSCEKCPCRTSDAFGGLGCQATGYIPLRKVGQDRPDWCPLVPVPQHGRLIDADALMKHKGNCYDADGHLLYAVGTGSIMCAPTIIPAEEGE